jgi:hypothetical protein
VDAGWHAYRRHPLLFSGFSLLSGGLNLLSQLVFRLAWAAAFTPAGDGRPLALAVAVIALAIYALTGLWLLVGLLRAAKLTMDGAPLSPAMVLRPDWPAMGRASGTLALLAVALWGVRELAEATASLLVLIQPLLASLPLVARLAVLLYLAADQVLCLPIAVLGRASPLRAVQSGRAAIDPHWLQALGLALVVGLILLAGVLLLLLGLVVALPVALCILTAAHRQLFGSPQQLFGPPRQT